jgi:hypothetical protein
MKREFTVFYKRTTPFPKLIMFAAPYIANLRGLFEGPINSGPAGRQP